MVDHLTGAGGINPDPRPNLNLNQNSNLPRPEEVRARAAPATTLVSHKVLIQSICKSQFPHKFVNLFIILVIIEKELTILCVN